MNDAWTIGMFVIITAAGFAAMVVAWLIVRLIGYRHD